MSNLFAVNNHIEVKRNEKQQVYILRRMFVPYHDNNPFVFGIFAHP